jgi:hypothetical protein
MKESHDQDPAGALGAYGVTKEQHDRRVAQTGRSYTDDSTVQHRNNKETEAPA